jgi:uncharacterized phage protein (TIGR01671 family)
MKDIKFRLWGGKKMFYDIENVMECLKQQMFFNYGGTGISYDHVGRENSAFMQYTGKKDKNGKEIYEGDILGNEMLRCVVEREEDGRWILRFKDIRIYPISILDHKVSKSAIVGNIHETPELLNEKTVQP